MVGSIIGSIAFVFLLAGICFLLYRRKNNRQKRENVISTPGNDTTNELKIPENVYGTNNEPIVNHGQEAISMANNEPIYNHGQEAISMANNEPIYNHGQHGQGAISMANNERSTLQNIDDGVLQQLVQALNQEVRLRQASNSNIARNNNK